MNICTPIWSIVIGILATAIESSLSFQFSSSKKKKKNSKKAHSNNCFRLSVKWKGVNKMTLFFAASLVSIGILECDSELCC